MAFPGNFELRISHCEFRISTFDIQHSIFDIRSPFRAGASAA